MDEKSRHEMIMRAKISYNDQERRVSMRNWIDRELREIGLPAMTEEEVENYALPRHVLL